MRCREGQADQVAAAVRHGVLHRLRVRRAGHARHGRENGPQGFFWLVVLAVVFVAPYMLLMAEVGSAFTQEGGPYEWTKMAFGRLHGGIAAILYWVTNPLWVGGSLAFIATDAWTRTSSGSARGSVGDYAFKLLFIWISIGVAIVSLRYGKWIPNAGAILRVVVLGFFSITVIIYAIKHGVAGFAVGDLSPTRAVFFGLVPLLLFNYVGFELQNGAAEEMENPQRTCRSRSCAAASSASSLYAIPIFCILLVLPAKAVTGIGGFIDAVTLVFHGVYGGAAHALLIVMTLVLRRRARHLGRGLDDRLRPDPGCRRLRRRVLPASSASSTAGSARRCASTSCRASSSSVFCSSRSRRSTAARTRSSPSSSTSRSRRR